MTGRKRIDSSYFDTSNKQYAIFADKLTQLDEDGWTRLRANCASLNSTSFGALIARARLFAKSASMIYPDSLKNLWPVKAATFAGNLFGNALSFGHEVVNEFDPDPGPWASGPSNSGDQRRDMVVNAARNIHLALAAHARTDLGTQAAVNAASQAVWRQLMLDTPTVAAVYAYVEPVIPFASLTPQA